MVAQLSRGGTIPVLAGDQVCKAVIAFVGWSPRAAEASPAVCAHLLNADGRDIALSVAEGESDSTGAVIVENTRDQNIRAVRINLSLLPDGCRRLAIVVHAPEDGHDPDTSFAASPPWIRLYDTDSRLELARHAPAGLEGSPMRMLLAELHCIDGVWLFRALGVATGAGAEALALTLKVVTAGTAVGYAIPRPDRQAGGAPDKSREIRADLPSPTAPPRHAVGSARWYGPGETVEIRGYAIGGMVYAGSGLTAGLPGTAALRWIPEPALLDPSLSVASGQSNRIDVPLPPWPSYAELDPFRRGRYLSWLAGGRRERGADPGLPLLFLHGLERRILIDRPDPTELVLLSAEIRDLIDLYGHHPGFNQAARGLLDVAGLVISGAPGSSDQEEDVVGHNRVRLAIAARLRDGVPVPARLAVRLLAPSVREKAVLDHAPEELVCLAGNRLSARHPDGIRPKVKAGLLSLPYQPYSRHIRIDLIERLGLGELPDPGRAGWGKVTEVMQEAAAELVPYARMISRRGGGELPLDALCLLPADTFLCGMPAGPFAEQAGKARAWLSSVAAPIGRLPAGELARRLLSSSSTGPKEHRSLSEVLLRLGFGLEPDPSDGACRLRSEDAVPVFETSASLPVSATWPIARFLAGMACALAGKLAAGTEAGAVTRSGIIADACGLADHERIRLQAFLLWWLPRGVPLADILDKLGDQPIRERARIRSVARSLAELEDAPSAGSRRSLVRIEDELGYGGASAAPAATPSPETPPAALDADRIRAILEETRQVSTLLSGIFVPTETAAGETNAAKPEPSSPVEGQPPKRTDTRIQPTDTEIATAGTSPEPMPATRPLTGQPAADTPGPAGMSDRFQGLDAAHAGLLSALLEHPSWTRAEYEVLAAGRRLMPDGAIEIINEWAYDRFGGPILEDGEPMEVDRGLLD